ncbi:reverse transcriptase-like protein [Pradoshia sp.]
MIEVYIDGAAKGNPGLSGAGIFIKSGEGQERYSIPLGIRDNHEAEYLALIHALRICQEKGYKDIISVRTDSKHVADAVEKEFVKKEPYRSLLTESLELAASFPMFFIKWIPESQNKTADQLSREAIRKNEH